MPDAILNKVLKLLHLDLDDDLVDLCLLNRLGWPALPWGGVLEGDVLEKWIRGQEMSL